MVRSGPGGDAADPFRGADTSTRRALHGLAADLRDLALDLQAGTYTRTTVAMLQRDLRRAVPSALGATISFDLDAPSGVPREIHLVERTLDPDDIAAGLRIPLILPQQSVSGSILFYAGEPGAFDDVARELLALLHTRPGLADHAPSLPAAPVSPSVVDVEDFSLVNDALGVLIHRGYSLAEARAGLQDRAAQDRSGLPQAARGLLDGLPTRGGRRAVRLLDLLGPAVPRRFRRPSA